MKKEDINIVFMGTPLFGAIILKNLITNNFVPSLVITQKDKLGDRGKMKEPEVKTIANKYGIKVSQGKKITEEPDLIITAAYGRILKEEIINLPKYGAYNIHPSLLPKYRGPSPIQYTILNGEKETGVSIFKMNSKMDEGDIVSQEKIKIDDENYESLFKKLANLSSSMILDIIPKIKKGEITLIPQDNSKATYSKIIRKEDGRIDWNESPLSIERKIRAFYPWPGVFTFWKKNDKFLRIKIKKVEISKSKGLKRGEVFSNDKELAVECLNGSIIIKELQIEGKKAVSGKDFILGNKNIIGNILK